MPALTTLSACRIRAKKHMQDESHMGGGSFAPPLGTWGETTCDPRTPQNNTGGSAQPMHAAPGSKKRRDAQGKGGGTKHIAEEDKKFPGYVEFTSPEPWHTQARMQGCEDCSEALRAREVVR
eukprot:scaffold262800_cov19-Tisochrysis_lutea.AAC.1